MVQEENLNVAFGLLREMASQGVEADATTYTTLFNLCAEARQGHQALQLMQVLPACLMHCHPDIVASASLWWEQAQKCHKSMHQSPAGSWLFYLSELQACAEANNLHQSFPSSFRAGLSSAAVVAVTGKHKL